MENNRKFCCIFDEEDPEVASKNKHLKLITDYGKYNKKNECLFCGDKGGRKLYQCQNCGKYVIYQENEFIYTREKLYEDYFPVEDGINPEIINFLYSGSEIEKLYPFKWLASTSNSWKWDFNSDKKNFEYYEFGKIYYTFQNMKGEILFEIDQMNNIKNKIYQYNNNIPGNELSEHEIINLMEKEKNDFINIEKLSINLNKKIEIYNKLLEATINKYKK